MQKIGGNSRQTYGSIHQKQKNGNVKASMFDDETITGSLPVRDFAKEDRNTTGGVVLRNER